MKFDVYYSIISILLLFCIFTIAIIKNKFFKKYFLFSNVNLFPVEKSIYFKLKHILPKLLFVISIILFLIALSRPQKGLETVTVRKKGLAIMLLMDRSGSMVDENQLTVYKGVKTTKLAVVKEILDKFILGGDGFTGRKNDLIGLITFAAFANENCPLTFEHQNLVDIIKQIEPADPAEDGTAIGDAIYYATLVMESFFKENEKLLKKQHFKIRDKIMILLTDGQNNFGKYDPIEAAKFAKKHHIKIYTIGIGTTQNLVSKIFGFYQNDVYFSELKKIAEITGGKFFTAHNGKEIENIYKQIDKLEKSEFKEIVVKYKELFQYFIIAGIIFLLLSELTNFLWSKNYMEN